MPRALLVLWLASAAVSAAAAADAPSATDVLERMGFSSEDRERVLAGHFVEHSVESDASEDIAVALSFLVRVPPDEFDHDLATDTFIIGLDPNTLAGGEIFGEGSLGDFSSLVLSASERRLYANARAGAAVNFSTDELNALDALGSAGPNVDVAMKKLLLARYRAYRAKGLAGIAPYDRGDGKRSDPGATLRRDSKAAEGLTGFDPVLARYLLDFPAGGLSGLRERFHWLRYEAHGKPALILVHELSTEVGQWAAVVQRQYYVSRGYNCEQAVSLLLPVGEGTLVVYLNHTSTDQVAGFGGSAKRAIGERLMASQLKKLFKTLRDAAATTR